ncbi:signal peptidase I [Brevibacillus sp. NPDC058079]|uniref:signal peptidase I n=1 Tax=Brevibacillus sp. NPDC058079 TaxID=3346330 RepID=UPI0036EC05DF
MEKTSSEMKKEEMSQTSTFKEFVSWIKVLIIAALIGSGVSFVIKPTLVSGESMFPTLNSQDYLILNRLAYKIGEPQHKDIVVFQSRLPGEKILIKRVIATQGEKISVKDGNVYVNDKLIDEPYLKGISTSGNVEGIVPENMMFVMGDNRGNSIDSRRSEVGFVSKDEVIGKVWFRLLPFKPIAE